MKRKRDTIQKAEVLELDYSTRPTIRDDPSIASSTLKFCVTFGDFLREHAEYVLVRQLGSNSLTATPTARFKSFH